MNDLVQPIYTEERLLEIIKSSEGIFVGGNIRKISERIIYDDEQSESKKYEEDLFKKNYALTHEVIGKLRILVNKNKLLKIKIVNESLEGRTIAKEEFDYYFGEADEYIVGISHRTSDLIEMHIYSKKDKE